METGRVTNAPRCSRQRQRERITLDITDRRIISVTFAGRRSQDRNWLTVSHVILLRRIYRLFFRSLLAAHVRIHAEDYPKRQSRTKIKSKKNADALRHVKIEPLAEKDVPSETQTQSEQQNAVQKEGICLGETSDYHLQPNLVKLEPVDDPMEIHSLGPDSESFIFEDMIDIQQVKVEMPSEIPIIETFAKSSKASHTKR